MMDEESVPSVRLKQLSETVQNISNTVQKLSDKLSKWEESTACSQEFSQTYISEVWNSVSISGLRFIGEKHQHRLHKYLWIFIHAISLFISYSYIKNEYNNWHSSPVVQTLSDTLTHVSRIPFPAVTICVPNAVNNEYDFRGKFKKCVTCGKAGANAECYFVTGCEYEEITELAVLGLICPISSYMNGKSSPDLIYSRDVNSSIAWNQYSKYIKSVFPQCDQNFLFTYRGRELDITSCGTGSNRFQYFMSENLHVMCMTINGLRHSDIYKDNAVLPLPIIKENDGDEKYLGSNWTFENMIHFNGSYDTVPMYNIFNDILVFAFGYRVNTKYLSICNDFPDDIVSIDLHNPGEIPIASVSKFALQGREVKRAQVTPKLTITDLALTQYEPSQRGCFYSYERELSLFKYYTENNCELECSGNCSLQQCGCVPFYLPRQNNSIRVCISECKIVSCDCNCLPNCISLSYKIEIKDFKTPEKHLSWTTATGIHYKIGGVYPTIRVSVYSLAKFVAYSFGTLGLFNGFSVMVLFELFYFLTVRLWTSVKTYLNQNV